MVRTLALIGGLLAFVDYFGAFCFWAYGVVRATQAELRQGNRHVA